MSEEQGVVKPRPHKTAAPRWMQVASILEERINTGLARDGRELSDIALANEFNVSTAVVRQAVGRLVEQGLLTRQRGKGTFVTQQPLQGGLKALGNFDAWHLVGREVEIEILELRLVGASIPIAAGLGVPAGETVTYLKRLRLADGVPVALDHRYVPADLMNGIERAHFREEALWRVLTKRKGVKVKEAIFTIRAAGAAQDAADALEVPLQSPVLHHESQVFDIDGRVIILGSTFYHPDRFVYQTSVQAVKV